MPRLHKAQYKNWHYGSERSQDLHDATQNLEHGIFQTGKKKKKKKELQNMSRNIYDVFKIMFAHHVQNTPKM